MQGGDVTSNARGDGQLSVYGPTFEDENFLVKHDSLGIIQEHIHIEKKYFTYSIILIKFDYRFSIMEDR